LIGNIFYILASLLASFFVLSFFSVDFIGILPERDTVIAASGQIKAHIAQPVQPSLVDTAGEKPDLLDVSDIAMQLFGQTFTHSPQPLHRSVSIVIFPFIATYYLILCILVRICKKILAGQELFVKKNTRCCFAMRNV